MRNTTWDKIMYVCAGVVLGGLTALGMTAGAATTPLVTAGGVAVTCTVPGNSAPVPALRYTVHARQSLTAWSYRHGVANSDVLVDTPMCAGGGWPLADLKFIIAINRGSLTVYPGTVLYLIGRGS